MPQASSFDSLLAQCRDLVSERLVLALSGMLDKSGDALSALAGEARDPQTQKLYTVTRNKVLGQRETIVTQFRLRYLREFQERGNRVKKIGDSFAEIDLSSLELELVAEDDLNETLRFNAIGDKLREYCDEELIALDQRAGVLLGDADLQAEDNPFTPQAICDAYKRTCHQIDSNVDVRMVLLKLFDDYVLDEIRGIYKAVNAVLVENSILPNIRTIASRRQGSGKAPPAGAKPGAEKLESAAPAGEGAPAAEQDFFSMLQKLVASNLKAMTQTGAAGGMGVPAQGAAPASGLPPVAGIPGAGAGAQADHAVLEGADLLRSLTRIQVGEVGAISEGGLSRTPATGEPNTTNVLRDLKGSSLGAGMNQMDSMTLDIVALLFDQLFDDPKIPIGVKGLIGRLQIPMLKVAIADKAFFSKKTHPARQMLDTLGEIAARLPTDVNASNPMFARMETILQELMEGFEDDVEIFLTVRERLQTLINEEDQRVEQETRSATTQMDQKESLALAKTVAQAEIKVRIRDREVPRAVVEFLIQQWVKLLLVVQVKDSEQSDAWKNALETMDLLISSVERKGTQEERRKLVTIVPDLLKRLTDGLKLAGVEDAVRLDFFAELRKLHSQAIGGTEKSREAAPPDAIIADSTVQPELSPADLPSAEPPLVAEPAPAPMEEIRPEPASPAEAGAPIPFEFPLAAEPVPLPSCESVPPESTPPVEPAGPIPFDLPLIAETAPAPVEAIGPDLTPPDIPAFPVPPLDLPSFDLPLVPAPASAPNEAVRPAAAPAQPAAPMPAFDLASFDLPLVAPPTSTPVEAARPVPTPPARPQSPSLPVNPARPQSPTPSVSVNKVPPAAAPAPKQEVRPVPTQPAKPAAQTPPARPPGPRETKAAIPAPLDFAAAVTVNNPFGQGEVQVDDLDFTAQLGAGTASPKAVAGRLDVPAKLVAGSWVAIRPKNEKDLPTLAKLSYVSPLKSRFLFVDRHGKNILECSRTELARKFQLGELIIAKEVPEPPLFDRLAEGLVSKLGGVKVPR